MRLPKPTRLRLLALGLAAACLYFLIAALAMRPPPAGVNVVNFHRIELGMPEAKVEEILGGPGKLQAALAGPAKPGITWKRYTHSSFKDATFFWVVVEYQDGVASNKFAGPGPMSPRPNYLERLRRLLGL